MSGMQPPPRKGATCQQILEYLAWCVEQEKGFALGKHNAKLLHEFLTTIKSRESRRPTLHLRRKT